MLRQVDLNEISDGRVYRLQDTVKADCNGCMGCSDCCRSTVKTISLDPYDIYNLTINLNKSFEELLAGAIELNIADAVILPNLKAADDNAGCIFLNEEGRCKIHGFRPGLCRLFPLGRFFDENSVYYILQIHECRKTDRSDVMVEKWIGIPDMTAYEKFSADWYYLIKRLKTYLADNMDQAKTVNMYLLKIFYLTPYESSDFYSQYRDRKEMLEKLLFKE